MYGCRCVNCNIKASPKSANISAKDLQLWLQIAACNREQRKWLRFWLIRIPTYHCSFPNPGLQPTCSQYPLKNIKISANEQGFLLLSCLNRLTMPKPLFWRSTYETSERTWRHGWKSARWDPKTSMILPSEKAETSAAVKVSSNESVPETFEGLLFRLLLWARWKRNLRTKTKHARSRCLPARNSLVFDFTATTGCTNLRLVSFHFWWWSCI